MGIDSRAANNRATRTAKIFLRLTGGGRFRKRFGDLPDQGFGEELVVVVLDELVPGDEVVVVLVVLLDDEEPPAGEDLSFTTVVLFSVLFSPGGVATVVSLFSQAASKAAPARMQMYFFIRSFDG